MLQNREFKGNFLLIITRLGIFFNSFQTLR